ncbi:transmembrane protein, putative (macronuclear) [Tetrahymena thermophila SB210]|uniref:Transmembrane protein, putative n=1 Tax=Tetrahymena thermophila (strain SB210) TaxID=312017 RepID=W7WXY0_TETTS|nr:transmembrane protein, putative [Tetrahymena thermophila SB210]EWS71710.1 transmembrane protein, putative [Tetrahymena thermophila SB210]|eukprot:XP_012655751.1 transmembrane protein, putative [Tetrahymena thermophila SB210]
MQGFGIAELQIRNLNFKFSNKISFLQISNSYNENSKQFIQKGDQFFIQNATIASVNHVQNSVISLTGNSFIINQIKIFNVSCSNCLGAGIQVQYSNQFILQDSLFQFNLAQKGGAIYIDSNYYNSTIIKSSIFLNNKALSSGGAIFLQFSNLQMYNTTIIENQALIGGGVRYLGIQPDFINQIINKDLVENNIINSITKNNASIHSNNFGSYSFSLKVTSNSITKNYNDQIIPMIEKDTIQVFDTVSINDFQSGGNIDVKFQILDLEGVPINFDQKLYESESYPQDVSEEIQNFKIITTLSNDKIKVYGQYISDQQQFNAKDRTFSIKDMNIVSIPETRNYFFFEVPSIFRAHNNNQQYYFKQERFGVKVNIQFRQCIAGEILTQSGSLFLCQECKEGFYSLSQPNQTNKQSQQCERCPENAEKCYKNKIIVKKGYWRISDETNVIIKCKNNEQNCNGNELTDYCKEGHIGPLCESCDSTGEMWGSRYMSDGKYNCINCKGLQNDIKFLLPSILVGIFMIFYILFSVKIALNISQNIIFGYYLRKLNMLNISKSAYQDTTNMNMKAMMNYIQISQLINTFEVDLPGFLELFPKYIGSPVNNFMYTLDCFLSTLQSKSFLLIFLRTIWGLMIPVIYIFIAGIIYFALYQFKVLSYNKSYLICGLVFIIFFLQPNIINNLLSVLSCRQIDQNYYILADVSHKCYTEEHIKFILSVCIPGLVLWGFILPMSILKILFMHRNKLDYAIIRLPYGFLYQDYTQQRFYWEFIKSYMKILIVVVLNFYGDPFNNKLLIIMIILLLYQVSLSIMKPYQMRYFQQLEKKSMITLTVITIMNIFLYNQPDKIQQQIFYLIVLGIHNIYLGYLIFEVVKAKLSIAQKKNLELIKKKIIQLFPSLSKFIKFDKPKDLKTFHNWNKIRKEILRIKMSSVKKDPSQKQNSSKSQQEVLPALISPLSQSINANIGSYNNISVKELIDSHKNLNGYSITSKKQLEPPSTTSFQSQNYFISQNVNTKRSQFFKDTHRTSRIEDTNQINQKSSKYLDINEIILDNSHFIFPKSTKQICDQQQIEQENKFINDLQLSNKLNKKNYFDFSNQNEKNESIIYKNLSKVYLQRNSKGLTPQKNSKETNIDEVEVGNLVESQINQVSPRKKINEMIINFHIDQNKLEDENSLYSTNINKEEKSDFNFEHNNEQTSSLKTTNDLKIVKYNQHNLIDKNIINNIQEKQNGFSSYKNLIINQQKSSNQQEDFQIQQAEKNAKQKNQNILSQNMVKNSHSKEQQIQNSELSDKFTKESSLLENYQDIQEHQTEHSKSLSS